MNFLYWNGYFLSFLYWYDDANIFLSEKQANWFDVDIDIALNDKMTFVLNTVLQYKMIWRERGCWFTTSDLFVNLIIQNEIDAMIGN